MHCLISDLSVGPNLNLKCDWLYLMAEPKWQQGAPGGSHHHIFLGNMV